MSDDTNDYDVGYGKPTKHSRFKPGQSGNPKGRPKRARNFKTDLREELEAPITITEGGQSRVVSRQAALIKRTTEKALNGDLRAVEMLVKWVGIHLLEDPEALAKQPMAQEDLALLERYGISRDRGSDEGAEENNDEQ